MTKGGGKARGSMHICADNPPKVELGGYVKKQHQASNRASTRLLYCDIIATFIVARSSPPCVLRQKQRIDTSRIAGFAFENAQSIKTKFA